MERIRTRYNDKSSKRYVYEWHEGTERQRYAYLTGKTVATTIFEF